MSSPGSTLITYPENDHWLRLNRSGLFIAHLFFARNQPATKSAQILSKIAVCASTSAAVVAGDINAIL